jgi:hypothetical protein
MPRVGPNAALGADSHQWILYRAMRQVPLDAPLSSRDWEGISFVRSWLAGAKHDAERTRQRDRGAAGTSPETIAGISATAARERETLANMKRPLSTDEKREVTARAGHGRRVAI